MDLAIAIAQLIAGVLGVVVAVIACMLGYKSYKSQERLAEKQLYLAEQAENRDELRYKQQVDAAATAFLQRNQTERLLIPLCEVAYRYNRSWSYRRDIYKDYCSLSSDVRRRIFEREGLGIHLPNANDNEFFDLILQRVKSFFDDGDEGCCYDDGKFLKRALTSCGSEPIVKTRRYRKEYGQPASRMVGDSVPELSYSEQISDVLSERKLGVSQAYQRLKDAYGFGSKSLAEDCQFATELAWWIVYSHSSEGSLDGYGNPEDYFEMEPVFMEDLFLFALYKIALYTDWGDSLGDANPHCSSVM